MAAHIHGKGRKEQSVPLWRSTASLIRGWKRRLEGVGDDRFLFPSRSGERMARSNVTQRLKLAVATAAEPHPQLAQRPISPHTVRHTTVMHLLQAGIRVSTQCSDASSRQACEHLSKLMVFYPKLQP
ncbi:tyrosine-type recombinase/integrase [Roseibium aggregatum]